MLRLYTDGHSAEEIADILDRSARAKSDRIPTALRQLAERASTDFGIADWNELKGSPPTPKTIRRWIAQSRSKQGKDVEGNDEHCESGSHNRTLGVDRKAEDSVVREEPTSGQTSDPSAGVDSQGEAEPPVMAGPHDPTKESFPDDACLAPPDDIDVLQLRNWGIPEKRTAEILYSWRQWHRRGRHDICDRFIDFRNDLAGRKVPFQAAKKALDAAILATEFHDEAFLEILEIGRKYRYWEDSEKRAAFLKEVQESSKPSPEVAARKSEHLAEVGRLLELLRSNAEMVLATQTFEMTFRAEKDPLFTRATEHSDDIWYALYDIIPRRGQYQALFARLVKDIGRSLPPGATEYFATLAARASINLALDGRLPKYVKMQLGANKWSLILTGNPSYTVASGDLSLVDQCYAAHIALIKSHRGDSDTRRLAELSRELRRLMMSLKKQLDRVIDKQTYIRTRCIECPY